MTVTLAVALARGGGAGRVAPALIGFGALVVPGVGPIGWGIIGLGLALAARRIRRVARVGAAAAHPVERPLVPAHQL